MDVLLQLSWKIIKTNITYYKMSSIVCKDSSKYLNIVNFLLKSAYLLKHMCFTRYIVKFVRNLQNYPV